MINGALFKLNLISDFDSNVTESTKVELIKVLNARRKKTSKYSFPATGKVITTERYFEGLITQTGTTAPNVTQFPTNSGNLNFGRAEYVSTGVYNLIFDANTFTADNKALVLLSSGLENASVQGYVLNSNTVRIETRGNGSNYSNDKLNKTSILIKTYV
jgi:hypothetical protein